MIITVPASLINGCVARHGIMETKTRFLLLPFLSTPLIFFAHFPLILMNDYSASEFDKWLA